jgi:hypothetical protein
MTTVKLYDCAECGLTMMVEVFADEATTLEIMKQNPTCNDCTEAATDSCPWCAEPVDPTDGFFCYQCKP